MMAKISFLRAWIKSAWVSFAGFCKERWELLLGVLVGVLGILAMRNREQEKVLEKVSEANRSQRDENIKISEDFADKISDAVEDHAVKQQQIEEDHRKKSAELSDKEEKIKEEILEREDVSPGSIAREINNIVD